MPPVSAGPQPFNESEMGLKSITVGLAEARGELAVLLVGEVERPASTLPDHVARRRRTKHALPGLQGRVLRREPDPAGVVGDRTSGLQCRVDRQLE